MYHKGTYKVKERGKRDRVREGDVTAEVGVREILVSKREEGDKDQGMQVVSSIWKRKRNRFSRLFSAERNTALLTP